MFLTRLTKLGRKETTLTSRDIRLFKNLFIWFFLKEIQEVGKIRLINFGTFYIKREKLKFTYSENLLRFLRERKDINILKKTKSIFWKYCSNSAMDMKRIAVGIKKCICLDFIKTYFLIKIFSLAITEELKYNKKCLVEDFGSFIYREGVFRKGGNGNAVVEFIPAIKISMPVVPKRRILRILKLAGFVN